jgi:hypothetical protein
VRFPRDTKDSDLVVLFGENAAAVLGLSFAVIPLGLAYGTSDSCRDAAGSLAIGLVLVGVAAFLGVELKSLLIGECVAPFIEAAVRELLQLITVQQGPGEVLVAKKERVDPGLPGAEVAAVINCIERALKARRAEIGWCFVEPAEHV